MHIRIHSEDKRRDSDHDRYGGRKMLAERLLDLQRTNCPRTCIGLQQRPKPLLSFLRGSALNESDNARPTTGGRLRKENQAF